MTRDALRGRHECAFRVLRLGATARKESCCNANTNDSQPHDFASFFGSRADTILRRIVYTTRSRDVVRSTHFANALAALSLGTTAAAFGQGPEPRAVYAAACAACHGDDGRGRSASELGFEVPLPDFTDCDFAVREPDSDWYAIAHRGGPIRGFDRLMPAFGEALQPEEIEAALARIRTFCTDDRWPRGELNMPRALFTEKAYPEDEAVITTTFVGEGGDSITHEFVWEQRFGPLNQIEIKMPITRADLGDPDGWKSGTGDLGIGVKHTMHHSLERGAILAVGGELVLPTGDETKGFGKGTTVLESFVLYGKLLPRDAFVQVQGILEFPNDSALEDEAVFRAALGKTWTLDAPFGRSFTPMIEVLAARELGGDAQTQWDLVPQLQVSLSQRQHVLGAVGIRQPVTDRDNRSTELVFYLLWDWFDGGVLQGWTRP
jgi:mono/diheme cytochrome c family protein